MRWPLPSTQQSVQRFDHRIGFPKFQRSSGASCSRLSYFPSLCLFQGVAEASDDTLGCRQKQKPVWNFIRILLMDSLLNVCGNTTTHPLILLLEVN